MLVYGTRPHNMLYENICFACLLQQNALLLHEWIKGDWMRDNLITQSPDDKI